MVRVAANGLGKAYRRYAVSRHRLLDFLPFSRKQRHSLEWAVRDVSFTVEAGQALGIIGLNGAGKSTLLRLLTGTTTPTEGSFSVNGKVAALLELGIGIHPEFTGWQNARLSLQLLGLDEAQIAEVLPWVQEFSELGDHMDHPVRTYSTGMQVRLAFSLATAVRPDVLIVDEALSVGDMFFQHRSLARIREMREAGTAILFVTHDPGAVKTLCDRVILLDSGRIVSEGNPEAVYDFYNALIANKEGDAEFVRQRQDNGQVVSTRSGSGEIFIERVVLEDQQGSPARIFPTGATCRLVLDLALAELRTLPTAGFLIRDRLGNDVFGTNTYHLKLENSAWGESTARVVFEVQLNLGPGTYSVSFSLHEGSTHLEKNYDWWDRAVVLQIVEDQGPASVGVAQLPTEASWVPR